MHMFLNDLLISNLLWIMEFKVGQNFETRICVEPFQFLSGNFYTMSISSYNGNCVRNISVERNTVFINFTHNYYFLHQNSVSE